MTAPSVAVCGVDVCIIGRGSGCRTVRWSARAVDDLAMTCRSRTRRSKPLHDWTNR